MALLVERVGRTVQAQARVALTGRLTEHCRGPLSRDPRGRTSTRRRLASSAPTRSPPAAPRATVDLPMEATLRRQPDATSARAPEPRGLQVLDEPATPAPSPRSRPWSRCRSASSGSCSATWSSRASSACRPPSPRARRRTSGSSSSKGPSVDSAPTSAARKAASTKIVIAGGFGVGKTTLVGSVSEIVPLRTEALVTNESEGVDDLGGRAHQGDHHGGHGLRPPHPGRGPRPLPVRHARPAPLLVHVGRPLPGRDRRHRAGRHRPARRVVLAAGLLRVQGPAVHRGRQPVRRRASATPSTRSPTPSRCRPTCRSSASTPATASRPRQRSSASPSTPWRSSRTPAPCRRAEPAHTVVRHRPLGTTRPVAVRCPGPAAGRG